ncbi:MAG: hypothetical protein V1889_02740 [archaeon]
MNKLDLKRAEKIRIEELKSNHPNNSIYIGYNYYEKEKEDKEFNYKAYQMMTPEQILSSEDYFCKKHTAEFENFIKQLDEFEKLSRKSKIVCSSRAA